MVRVIDSISGMQGEAESLRRTGKKVGLVPTMGYLHDGHTSLIRKAREFADVVITSVFVNPTQFGPGEDFEKYPRDSKRDELFAGKAGTDIIFSPSAGDMYPEGYKTYVEVGDIGGILEGRFRPTHFRGVATVVTKLFLIMKPHVAVFGQKDAQQAFIIQKIVHDLNLDVNVVVAPIVREPDGLAMSSRNVYLSREERSGAGSLYKSLKYAEEQIALGKTSASALRKEIEQIILGVRATRIDYIAFVHPASFAEVETVRPPGVLVLLAVRFGSTRLIDNLLVSAK